MKSMTTEIITKIINAKYKTSCSNVSDFCGFLCPVSKNPPSNWGNANSLLAMEDFGTSILPFDAKKLKVESNFFNHVNQIR